MVQAHDVENLLFERDHVTEKLEQDFYNIQLYLDRCAIHEHLGYPDLAAMDAYKALLLVDEVSDEGFEYHREATDSLLSSIVSDTSKISQDEAEDVCNTLRLQAVLSIASNLTAIGCLQPAYEYVQQALSIDDRNTTALAMTEQIKHKAKPYEQVNTASANDKGEFYPHNLPVKGYVRREVYPWNEHEADRTTAHALDVLNAELAIAAPKIEVKVTYLPLLQDPTNGSVKGQDRLIRQLGVFAKEDILPGEEVLRERSLLTANARLHEPLCDACNAVLPDISVRNGSSAHDEGVRLLVPCPDCDDIVFCNQNCYDLAQESYHPAVCGTDVEIQKDVPPTKAADTLYTLLLSRALAMARTQQLHPLDLKEVKYIWGDFSLGPATKLQSANTTGDNLFQSHPHTLPFTFESNILAPLHMLEKMDLNIFASKNDIAELWVWNTLYAKFRGTASARISPRDGRPEVAAVHPLWCLANHSCDPNITWEWGGEITFEARRERKAWQRRDQTGRVIETQPTTSGGIKKGEEILNHYVDVDLDVQARREWGAGALGGFCHCERCVWEDIGAVI